MQTLFSGLTGQKIHLPESLEQIYGELYLGDPGKTHYVIANFVTTIDGVISLNIPGLSDGGQISGHNPNDMMLMGILRALSDVVIIGTGTLTASPTHLWIAEEIYPPFALEYRSIRQSLGKSLFPVTVLVTSEGDIEPFYRIFQVDEPEIVILTTKKGLENLRENQLPEKIKIIAVKDSGTLTSKEILKTVESYHRFKVALIEGGPHLFTEFLAERTLDELFITLSPQIAGRDISEHRISLVENRIFNPGDPLWTNLIDIRKTDTHLFLRFRFK